jgi:predicted outer membrane repeat protein
LGIELLEVTPKVIAALRTIVLSAVAEQHLKDSTEPVRTLSNTARNEFERRLGLCRDTLDREAGILANSLLNVLDEKMADALGRTDRAFDRNQHVLAITSLKQSRPNVATQLQVLLLGEFITFTQSSADLDGSAIAAEGNDAARPEAADLSVFLSLGEVIAHLEVKLQGKAEALERALGQLLGRRVNHQNNPLSAENVCRVVYDLLTSVWPNKPNADVLRDALRDGLGVALPVLYSRLGEVLQA